MLRNLRDYGFAYYWIRIKRAVQSTILCWRYPFLAYYADRKKLIKPSCWYFAVDEGWKYLALQMFREIRRSIKRDGGSFRIYDIKEKDGYMTVDCGGTKDIEKIVDKYEYISFRTCVCCGRPALGYTDRHPWTRPYCEKHAPKGVKFYKFGTEEDKWFGTYVVGESTEPIIFK